MTVVLYRELASGSGQDLGSLRQIGEIEAQVPEGTCLQAELVLDLPDWALRAVAGGLNAALRLKGTTPCGDSPLAWLAPDDRTLVVRWRKGATWWGVIVGAIVALAAVGAVVVLFWRLSRLLQLPGWVIFVGVGLTLAAPFALRLLTEYSEARARLAMAEAARLRARTLALEGPPFGGQGGWL